ncbi:MAG: molybdopterin-dependent oxidoreductase [Phycisphaerales bacterium]
MPGQDYHSDFFRVTSLANFPPREEWQDWKEFDPSAWPRKVERRYRLVPTTCFNCEAACGLVAYVDKDTNTIRKLEGNPYHPGSRGRNCAKGPATLNQVNDPERILYPLKRSGPRGSGKFERTTWDEVLDTFASKIRQAILDDRRNEIMYHVGRPGADGYMDRVLKSWGIDGHNSHTNVCSSSARVGYALWTGADRPSPDHANARFILMLSSHLETGHYFNPHAQRIIEAKEKGAKICAVDIRLSNTASMADFWLSPHPGTEAFLLLSMAHVLIEEDLIDHAFIETWFNWREWLIAEFPDAAVEYGAFLDRLRSQYVEYTPEAAAAECGVSPEMIINVAREIGAAGSAFATHVWRNAAAGNLGGWQVSRCLHFLCALVGSVNARGGTNMNSSDKFVPAPFLKPPGQNIWNDLLYPIEYPLAFHEMSILLPHFLMEGRGRIAAYFTRVFNPVWTYPDGLMWERVLRDESKIELHAAMTPVWSETAQYADYVLPFGVATERHDLMSQETHAAKWISFRQPVQRVSREADGETFEWSYQANAGEVWEEDEFWIALSWRIDPDGELGIRKYYESPYRPGQRVTIEEYYRWIFENSVPGLPEEAARHGMSPLEYMRTHGAFLVKEGTWDAHMKSAPAHVIADAQLDLQRQAWLRDGQVVAVRAEMTASPHNEAAACLGFNTPSRRLEFYSPTMREWKWGESTLPGYIRSHIHRDGIDAAAGEFVLVPTFRLPTQIHTRSANSKWLMELSNTNPIWIHPSDADRFQIETTDLVRVQTRIGWYVNKAWVTEAVRPGVLACSHHLGRWRLFDDAGTERWASAKVVREELPDGSIRFRRIEGIRPFASRDPDSSRIWWTDGGVHQNMTFCVQPDPVSGMQCWHQKVTLSRAGDDDYYGDVVVNLDASMQAYREWLAMSRPGPGPGNLRRPLWFARAFRPSDAAYQYTPGPGAPSAE